MTVHEINGTGADGKAIAQRQPRPGELIKPKRKLALLLYRAVADQTQKSWVRSASFGLAVLSFINLFSYLDRYIVSALIESLKHSNLGLSDANLGSLMSGFLVVYTLTAPIFGALGDRRSRPRLIGPGCMTITSGLD